MSRRHIRRSSRAAFTLMEVLLVLVILVVLGSLAVGMFTGAQKKANLNAAQTQVDAISHECDRYNLDMNGFPPDLSALPPVPQVANANSWAGPYIDRDIPLDPWGNPYQYQFPGSRHGNEKPDIWSWGPDLQNGTDDDIYNR